MGFMFCKAKNIPSGFCFLFVVLFHVVIVVCCLGRHCGEEVCQEVDNVVSGMLAKEDELSRCQELLDVC